MQQLNKGGKALQRIAKRKRFGSLNKVAEYVGTSSGAISRHSTGFQVPGYRMRELYRAKLGISPKLFDIPAE